MKFYLIEQQAAACDYTIGCGIRITKLQATTLETAMEEAALKIFEVSAWDKKNEWAIDSAKLLSVSEDIDLKDFLDIRLAEQNKKEQEERDAKIKEKDEAEFERLKKKLGK